MFGFGSGNKGKKSIRVDSKGRVVDKFGGAVRGKAKDAGAEEVEEDIMAGGAQLEDDAALDEESGTGWDDDISEPLRAAEVKQLQPYETGLVNPRLAGLPTLNTMTQDETLMISAMLDHCSRYGMFIGSLSSRTPLATKGGGRLL